MPEKTRKYLIINLLFFFGVGMLPAANKPLSEQAQISILIGEPSDVELFSLFGHAALHIVDPELAVDYVFNYGISNLPAGIINYFRMFKGNLPCELYAIPFSEVEKEYKNNRRALNELVLNLPEEEKQTLWQSLLAVAQGKRHAYYNILTRNCTALPIELVEAAIQQPLLLPDYDGKESYRSYCSPCVQPYPWLDFLLNLSFGLNINRPLTNRETLFLPGNFQKALLAAQQTDSIGNMRPLAACTNMIVPHFSKENKQVRFTPAVCAGLLFALVLLLCIVEGRYKRRMRWLDLILFGVAGMAGCVLFYLQFGMTQWYVFPSWWILWLHPLHLMGAVWSAAKRFDCLAVYYHIFNLCALSVLLIGICFVPQYIHPAFVPLIIVLALRSMILIKNLYFNFNI